MPVGHELLIIALNGDSLAAGSTAHYPVTILNHRHKQLESCVCACTHLHTHTHTRKSGWRSLSCSYPFLCLEQLLKLFPAYKDDGHLPIWEAVYVRNRIVPFIF